jgi:uroporphyrinogen decarboxylase
MDRRELVRAAIERRGTERAPYVIDLCPEAWEQLQPMADGKTAEEFIDNHVKDIAVPWWDWYELGSDWHGFAAPTSQPKVLGRGSYTDLIESVKAARDQSDKYLLVRLYGIHFEKAYFARGIENFLADLAGEPEFARRVLQTINDRNLVMMENFLALAEIDGVLLGSDWGSQVGLLMAPDTWEEMIAPGEQRKYELVRSYGKDVWLHS